MQLDWRRLFLTADGRIGRQDFWIGAVILIVAGIVCGVILGWIPVIGSLIGLVFMYPWVCLASKRLHDFGQSGWLAAIPVGLNIVSSVIGMIARLMVGGAALVGGHSGAAAAGIVTGVGMLGLLSIVGLIELAFLLWVGLTPSQAGDNAYGPEWTPAVQFTQPPPPAA